MLVLTRRQDQIIDIGGGIEIMVVRIREDMVRIGVTAPPNVAISRREITTAKSRNPSTDSEVA